MMNLVTGGAGFVGRALVSALLARGEGVRVLDLAPPQSLAGVDYVEGSITDPEAAALACSGVKAVFHLAGNAQLWAEDESVFERVNLGGAEVMLEAAQGASVERFVHCSSLTTLVAKGTPRTGAIGDETVRHDPEEMIGAYPRSKLLAERAVEAAAAKGLSAVICLPTEPLGPGDAGLTPPTQMILDFVNGKTPAYIDCLMNFVDVGALAEGMIAARDKGRAGERYLLGGANTPMSELLAKIEAVTGRKMPKMKAPYGVAYLTGLIDTTLSSRVTKKPPKAPLTGVRLAGRQVAFSSEKAEAELGWKAPAMDGALAETIKWFEAEGLLDTPL